MALGTPDTAYRADVDGLRAYAVLLVLFFHLGIAPFSGGYIGVDVFFVISGFLITRLIRNEILAGEFRFSQFYIRRIRRLFPALFFTLTVTFAAAFVLLAPHHFDEFLGSLVSAVFSLSNVFFWFTSGYFSLDAKFVPLLHTWSLSVEEQFYFIWPVSLVALLATGRAWAAPVAIAVAGIASLVVCEWYIGEAALTFYMLPFRIFEFGMGAAMVWLSAYRVQSRVLLEALVLAGLALIFLPAASYTEETLFPGLHAIAPCLGTSLLIYAGQAPLAGRLLNNPLTVYLGLISYSLYLIHWPIFVFCNYQLAGDLTALDKWIIVAASIACAGLMHRFVERPFRVRVRETRKRPQVRFAAACAALALVIALPAAAGWVRGELPGRSEVELQSVAGTDFGAERNKTWRHLNDNGKAPAFSEETTNVIVVGDSHAKDLFNALSLNAHRFAGFDFAMFPLDDRCLSNFSPRPRNWQRRQQRCVQRTREFKASPLLARADWVLMAPKWGEETIRNLPYLKAFLEPMGVRLAIAGNTAEFFDVPTLVYKHGRREDLEAFIAEHRDPSIDELNLLLMSAAARLRVPYLERADIVCAPARGKCDVLDESGRILFYDYSHWTLAGAQFFGHRLAEAGIVQSALSKEAETAAR